MAKDKSVPVKSTSRAPARRLDDQLEALFSDFFHRRWPRPFSVDWPRFDGGFAEALPPVDVVDRDSDVLVRAEIPGIAREDLEVSISDDTLTIKGQSRREEEKDDGDYHRREIVSRSVSRTVSLPRPVEGDRAKAQLKDGVLEITLPKAAPAQRTRIDVES
jgi:HSP20 family protein